MCVSLHGLALTLDVYMCAHKIIFATYVSYVCPCRSGVEGSAPASKEGSAPNEHENNGSNGHGSNGHGSNGSEEGNGTSRCASTQQKITGSAAMPSGKKPHSGSMALDN